MLLALAPLRSVEINAPAAEEGLAVDVLTPEQFDAIVAPKPAPALSRERPTEPSAPPALSSLPQQSDPAPQPAPDASGWRRPTQMLSQAALAEPRNRKAAARLKTLEASTRLQQLCDFEAMLQIARADTRFRPESVVAYAMAETRAERGEIVADGAAFHSGGQWYNLAFKCRISAGQERVQAFAFAIGAPIPQRDWASRNLPLQPSAAGDE